MFKKRFIFLFFSLVLIVIFMFPGVILAEHSVQVEVGKDGLFLESELEGLRIEVEEGHEVNITFKYVDNLSYDNPHSLYINGYNIKVDVLSRDNPEVTVKFFANTPGEFTITCISDCTGHEKLQGGKLVVGTFASATEQVALKTFTMDLSIPEQTETGQPFTLVALIKDELAKPVEGSKVKFFIKTDFFVEDAMMEIGEEITDERGLAKMDYVPGDEGVLHIIARYDIGVGRDPIEAEREITIIGDREDFYQSIVGIQFPKSFYIWMIALIVLLIGAWGTFMFVLYKIKNISVGTGVKGISLILMIIVAALFIMLVFVIISQEPQIHFSLLP